MLSLAVFFAAISISTEVYSTPIQEIDLENILQYAQERENKPDRKDREIFGSLKSQEIADLVQKATEDKVFNDQTDNREYKDAEELLSELTSKHKNRYNKNEKVTFGHYYDKSKDYDKNALENVEDNEFDDNDESYKSSRFNEQALEELLSKNVKKYNNLKPRLASLSNAGPVELNNDRNDDDDDADEYSKVYIILNPQAIEKSSNKKNLNKLLSKILSLTSSPASPSETGRNKKYKDSSRYKGFPVKSRLARRARHDSVDREVYASGDDDYKPKRGRSERGSGGLGGAGGRTAIPYIRNRGDIYERDH